MASSINASITSTGIVQTADATGILQLQSNGTTGITVNANANVTVNTALAFADNSILSTANSMGMRNRLINGNMAIDQRNSGASQTFTAAAALAYTVDRWYGYCTGANVTGQQVANTGVAGVSPSQYAYQFTGAASVTAIGFAQRIEAVNCYDLANTTATLSVNLSNSVLTTVTWTAYYANTTDTFGTLASPTKTQIATGTFTVTSTLTRYSTQISIPSNATTGIEIVFTVGAQTSGTWIIGNVQLEAGSAATPFERRLIPQELVLCQRYYEQQLVYSLAKGAQYDANGWVVILYFKVTKRATPNITSTGSFSQPRGPTTQLALMTSGSALDGATVYVSAEL